MTEHLTKGTGMAKYLILIYGDEQRWDAETTAERAAKERAHAAFRDAAGAGLLGGHELEAASTATTLRAGTGAAPTPTDGPFLETKEAIGGFYVLEAPDLDAALALASRLPELRSGHAGVEIRPIVEHG
ncbi:YciI family protein [Dactylosporangium salmoneum]|uniref:YCII-related domain-containing protein n=1 Tax=Dactylosporangium salmoneum TaxID=53361 RepID=A0ABN3HMU1_9ACTN